MASHGSSLGALLLLLPAALLLLSAGGAGGLVILHFDFVKMSESETTCLFCLVCELARLLQFFPLIATFDTHLFILGGHVLPFLAACIAVVFFQEP